MQQKLTSANRSAEAMHLWHGSTDKALELVTDLAWDLEAHQENTISATRKSNTGALPG